MQAKFYPIVYSPIESYRYRHTDIHLYKETTWRQRSTKKKWRARSDRLDNFSRFVVLDDSVIQAALHGGIPKILKYVYVFPAGKLGWGKKNCMESAREKCHLNCWYHPYQFRHLIHFQLGTSAPGFLKAGPHDNLRTLWWCCTPPSPWHCCKHLHIPTWANLTFELSGTISLTILLCNYIHFFCFSFIGRPSGCWTNTTSECFFNRIHDPQIASQIAWDGWGATVADRTTVLSTGICLIVNQMGCNILCVRMSPSQNFVTPLPPRHYVGSTLARQTRSSKRTQNMDLICNTICNICVSFFRRFASVIPISVNRMCWNRLGQTVIVIIVKYVV